MNLVKWNPMREVSGFHNRINRFFDEAFFPTLWVEEDFPLGSWKPLVDVYDDHDKIVMRAELPGVDKKDIHVDLKDRVLTLRGERSYEKEVKEDKYYRKERASGKFHRAFTLPSETDPEKIKAAFKDGVLKIEIPKREEEKSRKITVH